MYSQDLAETICRRIAAGEPLTRITDEKAMPNYATVTRWLREFTEFSTMYAQAREIQADTHFDYIMSRVAELDSATDMARVQALRAQIDAAKWAASKLKPRVYGDKLDVDVSGTIAGTAPMQVFIGVQAQPRAQLQDASVLDGDTTVDLLPEAIEEQ